MVTPGTSIYTKKYSQVTAPTPCPRRGPLNVHLHLPMEVLHRLQEAISLLTVINLTGTEYTRVVARGWGRREWGVSVSWVQSFSFAR